MDMFSLDKSVYVFLIFSAGLPYEIFGIIAQDISNIDCTFDEGLCSWTQDKADGFDWTRQSGHPPYSYTGPSNDHTTGHGHYMYIESSKHKGKSARLISPSLASGQYCLIFWYHAYHNHINSLKVLKRGTNESVISLNKNYQKGSFWKYGWVRCKSDENFQFVIEAGVRDDKYHAQGDIAVDDISATSISCPLDCSFEDGTCTWSDLYDGNTYNWGHYIVNTETLKDSYIYIFKNVNNDAGRAELKSSLQAPGMKCMSILLRITGNEDNTLAVFVRKDNETDELRCSISNKKSQEPEKTHVEIHSLVPYRVLLSANASSGANENVHIIEITTVTGHCPEDCDSSPCFNGATCEQSSTDDTYTCVCTEGWTGLQCTDIVPTTEAPTTAGKLSSTTTFKREAYDKGVLSGSSHVPVMYIVAPVIACIVVVIVGIFLYLWRQRRTTVASEEDATTEQHESIHYDDATTNVNASEIVDHYSFVDGNYSTRTEETVSVKVAQENNAASGPEEHNIYTPLNRHESNNENTYMPLIHRPQSVSSVTENPMYVELHEYMQVEK